MQTKDLVTTLEKSIVIISQRIMLRPFDVNDVDDMFEYASDDDVTEYLNWTSCTNYDDIIEVLNRYHLSKPGVWAIELIEEKKCIGCIDLRIIPEHQKASFGYVLNKKYWNNGYMTEAVLAVINFAFNELNLNRIEATYYVGNEGSGKVMKKCNMKYEGIGVQEVCIKNVFRDVVHYALLRSEWINSKLSNKQNTIL